ncbi:hypothetical protein BGZ73_008212 [Actinomortierella ambigua]|nr:hypothetical protein BGZ73_008212 [Actinomortierella ambigua]
MATRGQCQTWTTIALLLLNISATLAKFGIGPPLIAGVEVDMQYYRLAGVSLGLWLWLGFARWARDKWMDRLWWMPLRASGRPLPRVVDTVRKWRDDLGWSRKDDDDDDDDEDVLGDDGDVEAQRRKTRKKDKKKNKGRRRGEIDEQDPEQPQERSVEEQEEMDRRHLAKAQSSVMRLILVFGHGLATLAPTVAIFGLTVFFMDNMTSNEISEYKTEKPNADGYDCKAMIHMEALTQCEVDMIRTVAAAMAAVWLVIDMALSWRKEWRRWKRLRIRLTEKEKKAAEEEKRRRKEREDVFMAMGMANTESTIQLNLHGKIAAEDELAEKGEGEGEDGDSDDHVESLQDGWRTGRHIYAADPGQKIEISSMSDIDLSPRRLWELRLEQEAMRKAQSSNADSYLGP